MRRVQGEAGRLSVGAFGRLIVAVLLCVAAPARAQDYTTYTAEELVELADNLAEQKRFSEAVDVFAEMVERYELAKLVTGADGQSWARDLRIIYGNLERDEAAIALDRRMITACGTEEGAVSECENTWRGFLAKDLETAQSYDDAYGAFREWQDHAEATYGVASTQARQARWDFSFFLQRRGWHEEAIALRERSLAIEEQAYGTMNADTVEHADRLYEFYFDAGQYDQAEALARRFAEAHIAERGFDDFNTQLWRFRVSVPMQRRGDPEGALRELEAIVADAKGAPTKYPLDTSLLALNEQLGRYDAAEQILLKDLAEAGEDPEALGDVWTKLAEFYDNRNRLAEAESYYLKLVAMSAAEDDAMFEAIYRLGLAGVYVRQGKLDAAQVEYENYYKEFAPDGSANTFASAAIAGLANIYRLQGDAPRAEKFLLDVLIASGEPAAIAELASLYVKQGRYDEAEPLLNQLVADNVQIYGYFATTNYYETLADLYLAQGRLDEAWSIYLVLLEDSSTKLGANSGALVPVLTKMAATESRMGDFARSGERIDQALANLGAEADLKDPAVIELLAIRARNLVGLGQFAEAKKLYGDLRVASAGVLGEDHLTTIELTREFARAAFRSDYEEDAIAGAGLLVQGLEARNRNSGTDSLSVAQGRREASLRTESYLLASDILYLGQDAGDVRDRGFEAVQRAMETVTSEAVIRSAIRRNADQKAGGLSDMIVEREALQEQFVANAAQYADTLLLRGEEVLQRRARLTSERDAIQNRIATIDQAIVEAFPDYFDLVRPAPLDTGTARRLLRPDEAVVMIVPGDTGTHVFTVTNDQVQWRRSEWTAARVSEATQRLLWFAGANVSVDYDIADKWEQEVGSGALAFDRDTAFALYNELFAPSSSLLDGKRHLFVAASGALSSLPFAMLVTSAPNGGNSDPEALRQTDWLGDRYALIQLPTLQSLAMLRRKDAAPPAARSSFVGFGDPLLGSSAQRRGTRHRSADGLASADAVYRTGTTVGGGGGVGIDPDRLRKLSSLPGTGTELRAMAKALGAGDDALHLGGSATESSFKQQKLDNVAIIALATHGLMAGEIAGAIEPGLVFTPPSSASSFDDGYLTASEVAELRLNADWVILSACNTASGDGTEGATGLSGLARAFFYAGADNLLASHWPVRDDVAALITVRTVEIQRADTALSRAEAFQRAMREIRLDKQHDSASDSWAHPNAWAPFTLIGDSSR